MLRSIIKLRFSTDTPIDNIMINDTLKWYKPIQTTPSWKQMKSQPADQETKAVEAPESEEVRPLVYKETITDKNRGDLAKALLWLVAFVYLCSVILTLAMPSEENIGKLIQFSFFFINTVASMVLGYYFGRRS